MTLWSFPPWCFCKHTQRVFAALTTYLRHLPLFQFLESVAYHLLSSTHRNADWIIFRSSGLSLIMNFLFASILLMMKNCWLSSVLIIIKILTLLSGAILLFRFLFEAYTPLVATSNWGDKGFFNIFPILHFYFRVPQVI